MQLGLHAKRASNPSGNSGLGAAMARALGAARAKVGVNYVSRPGDAENLVLASDSACYVTATTVFIDGGVTDHADFIHGI